MKNLLLALLLFICMNSYAIYDMNITRYHIDSRISLLRQEMNIDENVFIRIAPLAVEFQPLRSATFHEGIEDFTIRLGDMTQGEAKKLILVEMSYLKMIHEGRLQRLSPYLFIFEGDTIDCTEIALNKTAFYLESKRIVNEYKHLFKPKKTFMQTVAASLMLCVLLVVLGFAIKGIKSEIH